MATGRRGTILAIPPTSQTNCHLSERASLTQNASQVAKSTDTKFEKSDSPQTDSPPPICDPKKGHDVLP